MSKESYDVGYGRPPKHTQFAAGESGNKGRKKKRAEFQTEMVARIRDECITVDGVTMTMLELAIRRVVTTTIKRGHPRDLKALFDLLEKYGAVPQAEAGEEARAAGERVVKKILEIFERMNDIDPNDSAAVEKLQCEEAAIVMKCPSCSLSLRERWNLPARKELAKRYSRSGLQNDVQMLKKASS